MWRKWSLDFKQWSMKYSIVWSLPSNKAGKELSQGCICHSSYPFNTLFLACFLFIVSYILCYLILYMGIKFPPSVWHFHLLLYNASLEEYFGGRKSIYSVLWNFAWNKNTLCFRFCKFCEKSCYIASILSTVRKSVALLKKKHWKRE